MKRKFFLAVSVVALSVVSHQLFAAELETPAPQAPAPERAAPAAERPAPAAQRERAPAGERQAAPPRQRATAPAPERQAAPARQRAPARPTQQASAQPSQSSWTGSQVGGYGGGNAGGGGFSDQLLTTKLGEGCKSFSSQSPIPIPISSTSPISSEGGPIISQSPIITQSPISSQSPLISQATCAAGPGANGSMPPAKFTAAGVLSFETPKIPVPLGGWGAILIGAVIDVGTGTSSSDYTQVNTYSTAPPIGPDPAGQTTNETIHFSFRERVSSSLRAKVGVPIFNYWALVYFTAGVAVAKTEASYSYSATNFAPGCAPGAGCATNVSGSGSFNQTRTGFSGGGGVEVQTGIPGVKVAFDYTYTNLGSLSQTVPVGVANCAAGAGLCTGGAETVNFNHLSFQRAMVGVKLGL